MQATFYNFKKARNDTSVPQSGTGVEVTVRLKDNVSILRPSFVMQNNIRSYNYFYVPDFNRYYFVTDFKFLGNNTYVVSGAVDVLASYRTDILGSKQYVKRASIGWNKDLLDIAFPSKGGMKYKNLYEAEVASVIVNYQSGTYIIGTIGSSSGYAGVPVTYYALNYSQMQKLNAFLFNSDSYKDMVSDDIVKAFFNPMDYLVSCVYFPVELDTTSWETNVLEFGWFRTNIQASKVEKYNYHLQSAHFDIVKQYDDYRNMSPWSQYRLWLLNEFYDIPAEKLYHATKGTIDIELDLVGGLALIQFSVTGVSGRNSETILNTAIQFGCPVSLAQTRQDWVGAITSVGSMIGNAMKFDVSGVAESTLDAINSLTPDPSARGSNGTLGSAFWQKYIVFGQWYMDTVDLDATRIGRPVETFAYIGNYSGYVLCKNAEISINAYEEEMDAITNFLNGGIYVI